MYKQLIIRNIEQVYKYLIDNKSRYDEFIKLEKYIDLEEAGEYYMYNKCEYLHDIWWRESYICEPCKSSTIEFVDKYMQNQVDDAVLTDKFIELGVYNANRNVLKIRNLNNAMDYLFSYANPILTTELVAHLHKIVMLDLLDNCGEYRINNAKPSGFPNWYLAPNKIHSRLTSLIETVSSALLNCTDRLRVIAVASVFYTEYLHIHPFSNGNGRTARLLTNYLMKPYFIVPFRLITCDVETHLNILQECQELTTVYPKKIAEQFIEGLILHYDHLFYLTMN